MNDLKLDPNDYYVTISLMSLRDARVITDENRYTGEEERGVFIPIKSNNILENEKGYLYLTMLASALTENSGKYSHLIHRLYSPSELAEIRKTGMVEKTRLGSMKIIKKFRR